MANNDIILKEEEEKDSQTINIPIKKADFGKFVTELLGQSETINFTKKGNFIVSFQWLKHIHSLLEQRITQQANCNLVDFSARFLYDTGASRKITNINTFLNFNELKIVRTENVKIVWTYLVKFPNKETPEKQEIELFIHTNIAEEKDKSSNDNEEDSFIYRLYNPNFISLEIKHTERTWGDDLFTILEREIKSVFLKEESFKKTKKYCTLLISIFFILLGLLIPDYIQELIKEKEFTNIYNIFIKDDMKISDLNLNDKMSYIINLIQSTNKLNQIPEIYRIASIVMGGILAIFTLMIFKKTKKSYILITEQDLNKEKEDIKKSKNSVIKRTLTFITAITISILANYIYYYLNVLST